MPMLEYGAPVGAKNVGVSFFILNDRYYLCVVIYNNRIIFQSMRLTQLSLINYRNIAEASLTLSPKLNCMIGNNGEGKTNLLDAVYYLSFCRSTFTPHDASVIRHDAPFFSLEGVYEDGMGGQEVIQCGMKKGVKKVFRRNKKAYRRLSEHIGLIPVIMVSPSDGSLIDGGSEVRRRMMDAVLSQYDREYLDSLSLYDRALMQRNSMLRAEEEPDPTLLDILEEQMAVQGTLIYERRKTFAEQMQPCFHELHSRITQQKDDVRVEYISHGMRGDMLSILREGRKKERIVGYSLYGVHRDELKITLNHWPIKQEGSQGQHKSVTISLRLALYKLLRQHKDNVRPILLLDDIFDKLDARRVEQIVQIVSGDDFGQIFITDTNRTHIDKILHKVGSNHQLFQVEQGRVEPIYI